MLKNKMKHNKIKNTGILFELLTRQITADLMERDTSKAVNLVKKYFKNGTEIGKEYQLYKILTETKYNTESRAETLVEAVLDSRKKLNNTSIRREKYNLIKEVRESYQEKDFFNTKINNYKVLASIYNLFQHKEEVAPDEYVATKFTIIEGITSTTKAHKTNKTYEYLKKQEKDLRILAYSTLVEKFNKKYSNLTPKQKKLIKEYINNISNTNKLREYVDSEVEEVKDTLKSQLKKVDDTVTQIKLTEVMNQIDGLKKGNVVSDKQVVSMMRYYELIGEIDNVAN
jgi:hypothetical protein|tara:strand:- start:90 stop:944 length:855 start_codon:yes stop_codon:yes gene_type:complete